MGFKKRCTGQTGLMCRARPQGRQNPLCLFRFSLKMERTLKQEVLVIFEKNELLQITVIVSP